VTAAARCSAPIAVPTGCRPSVVTSDNTAVQNSRFVQLMRGSRGNDPAGIISTAAGAGQLNQQPVHTTAPLILNLTPLPGSGGLLILSSQTVESAVSSRPSPAVDWRPSDSSVANSFSSVKSHSQLMNDSGLAHLKPLTLTAADVANNESSQQNYKVTTSSEYTSLEALQLKGDTSMLDSVSLSQAFGTGYRTDDATKTNCNDLASFDCLSLLLEQADDCASNASAVGGDDISVDTSRINVNKNCDSIVDELDDILHLVNESLGECDGEEDASSSLHNGNISLGDGFVAISNPKSLHVATGLECLHQDAISAKLMKITDFSPEWSYVEASYT